MIPCEKIIKADFKQRFLYLKIQRNVTLEEIAESIGSYKATLSKIVNSKAKLTDDMLTKLSEYFNVTKSYLLGETDYPYKKDENLSNDLIAVLRKAMNRGITAKKIELLFTFLDELEDIKSP